MYHKIHSFESVQWCNSGIYIGCRACRILVPQPDIEPVPPAVDAQSPNHWTAKEFPVFSIFTKLCNLYHNLILEHVHHPKKGNPV